MNRFYHNEMIKSFGICILSCPLITGCGTAGRFSSESPKVLYPATKFDIAAIDSMSKPIPDGSWYVGPPPVCCLPFPIIDLPFAIILDSCLLPYDLYRSHPIKNANKVSNNARFWKTALESDIITTQTASNNYTDGMRSTIQAYLSSRDVGPNFVTAVFEMAMNRTNVELLEALSRVKQLSPNQCRTLYERAVLRGWSRILRGLAINSATPLDVLEALARSADYGLFLEVALSGRLSASTIAKALAYAKPEWYQSMLRDVNDAESSPEVLRQYANYQWDGGGIQVAISANSSTPEDLLKELAKSPFDNVRAAVAGNKLTPFDTLTLLSKDSERNVRVAAEANLRAQQDSHIDNR